MTVICGTLPEASTLAEQGDGLDQVLLECIREDVPIKVQIRRAMGSTLSQYTRSPAQYDT
jgi:hypothetical protein